MVSTMIKRKELLSSKLWTTFRTWCRTNLLLIAKVENWHKSPGSLFTQQEIRSKTGWYTLALKKKRKSKKKDYLRNIMKKWPTTSMRLISWIVSLIRKLPIRHGSTIKSHRNQKNYLRNPWSKASLRRVRRVLKLLKSTFKSFLRRSQMMINLKS